MSVEQDAAAVVAVPAHHDEMENGLDLSTPKKGDGLDGLDELGQLSPSSRRRSTRASAIKAQEKIKIGDIPLVRPPSAQEMEEEEEEEEEEGGMKRRKLADGSAMDQFSHRFGLQVKDDEVYVLSDGSEVSSLHDSEISVLKKNYEKLVAAEPSEEQKAERLAMIRRAESELRGEEARLAMLKKMRSSQTQGAIKVAEASRKLASSVPQNGAGAAYKPAVATTPNKPGAKPAAASNPMLAFAGLTVKQQQEFLQRAAMNPTSAAMAAQALLAASKSGGNSAQAAALAQMFAQAQAQAQAAAAAQNKATASTASNNKPSGTSTPTPSAAVSAAQLQAKQLAAQTPQQRAAAARQAFRRQADQQLMTIPAPKAPPTDLFFISNPAQPDFCALVGLDLCVQKVLKDKTVNAAVNEGPYECEECGTDFTPSWRAIGADETDLHLYCEQCVRAAQKKKIRHDHQALLKKAYARIGTQEKEFEKQIADGKLDAALAAAAASASTSGAQQTQPQNLSTRPSGTSTPLQKPSTPLPSTSTPKPATPSTAAAPASAKRPATSTANAMQVQAQLAALAQMARSNPMMAAMMSNMGQMQMQQLQQLLAAGGGGMAGQMGGWNPMAAAQAAAAAQAQAQAQREKEQKEKEAREQREREAREARERQQHQQQQAAAAAAASMGGGMNMAAMNLLMAAAQSQAQGNAAAQIQAAFGGMNPAALLQNPQLLRQMQLQMAQLTSRKK